MKCIKPTAYRYSLSAGKAALIAARFLSTIKASAELHGTD